MPDPKAPTENPLEYAAYVAGLIDRVQPVDRVEFRLAIRYARIVWRDRLWEDVDLSTMSKSERREYQRRIRRSCAEMLAILSRLQRRRLAAVE